MAINQDDIDFVRQALDLLPSRAFNPLLSQRHSDTNSDELWVEVSNRAQNLLDSIGNDLLYDFATLHEDECWPEHFRLGRSYFDSTSEGGSLALAIHNIDWHIAICTAYQPGGSGGNEILRRAIERYVDKQDLRSAILFVERLWRKYFVIQSEIAAVHLWALSRADAFGLSYRQSVDELFGDHRRAQGQSYTFALSGLISRSASTDREHGRDARRLVDIYMTIRQPIESRLHAARVNSTNGSAWLTSIRELQPWYKALQQLAEEARDICASDSQCDEYDALARFADERVADITTCLSSVSPVGLAGASTRRSLEYLYLGRVMFPSTTFKAACSMLGHTGSIDDASLCEQFNTSLSPGHRWLADIVKGRMRELVGTFVAALQSGKLEASRIRRQRVVNILLATSQPDRHSPFNLMRSAIATGMARDIQTEDDLLVILKEAIVASAGSTSPISLADLPFILWSAAAYHPPLGSITDARAILENIVTLLVSSSFSHLPQGGSSPQSFSLW
jgi:hypothetical protein